MNLSWMAKARQRAAEILAMGAEQEAGSGRARVERTGRIHRPRLAADQRGVLAWLPGVHAFRHYQPAWLRHDLVAGLALTAFGGCAVT